ncbi:MAG: hypothetical protein HY904_10590 [Deltaproteobacteria bacterium]|nr:hypothetical protein [Deltaproteobacteria bacterium]
MRRGLAVLGTAAWVLAGSCGNVDPNRPDHVVVEHSESVDIPGGPSLGILAPDGLNPANAGGGLTRALSSTLSNQGVSKGDVKNVSLTQLHLAVTAPLRNGAPIQDLRFLDRLTMTMSAEGLPDVVVAESLPAAGGDGGTQSPTFGPGVFAVDIPPVPGLDLKDYVTQDAMTVKVEVTANGRPALSCTVQFTVKLDAQLNPVGAAANRLPFLP